MDEIKEKIITESVNCKALQFGSFKLKSGRVSPYFFNAGNFYSGHALGILAEAFVQRLISMNLQFDTIFGPAYKGISLAAITAMRYTEKTGVNVSFAYNRKEVKDHGEGGILAGAPLNSKRVVLIDDVITAGTAINEAVKTIESNNGELVGIALLLNRMERGSDGSKIGMLESLSQEKGIPIEAVITLQDIINSASVIDPSIIESIKSYRVEYGI